ncbi:hypothetical protein C0Q70_02977 [Pomacea canaliculata]|uniref:Deleted in malignant brain tumors 1 protein n=1 Tax=Pomacea canaliculata TaxID=400727 RepID=A0A2T7PRK2_POMCA|nr:hypothetical protein C0Q70_02977 [Pomacea canaliculata]
MQKKLLSVFEMVREQMKDELKSSKTDPGVGAQMYYGGSYGPAPGETYRGTISCYYYPSNFSDCNFGPETTSCDPQNALGISCNTSSSEVPNMRLVGGKSAYEGRVEVFLNGVWGTVTDSKDYYSGVAANVICRGLHGNEYSGSVVSKEESAMRFDILKNRAIAMQEIACNGNEKNLHECYYQTGLESSNRMPNNHIDDLAVVCNKDGERTNEGRVEVFKNGSWVSLCRPLVNGRVAEAICEQLGFSSVGAQMYYGGSYGPAPGEIYRGTIDCNYYHSNYSYCTFGPETSYCDPQQALGISCNTSSSEVSNMRLVGGKSVYEGRVEVFLNGVWGTVTDSNEHYSAVAANVICRGLHGNEYGGSVVSKQESPIRFGILNHRAIAMQEIVCNGNEKNLHECYYQTGREYSNRKPDNHSDDLAVVCKKVPEGCNGYTQSARGKLTYPEYPTSSVYNYDIDCIWKIYTNLGNVLSFLEVDAFDPYNVSRIDDDNVLRSTKYVINSPINITMQRPEITQIFDGDSEASPTVGGPYCGTQLPAPVDLTNSTSFAFTISLRSDGKSNASAHETGFEIYFRIYEPADISMGPYNASSGNLSTPGYPNVYNGEADIIWTITTKPYTTITLYFQDFYTEQYLYVSTNGYPWQRWSIYNGPVDPVIVDSNSVNIRLYSHYDNNINKVRINWTTECRQVIESQQGPISSPDDPEFYSAYPSCSYTISVTEGYFVSLIFSSIDLTKDTQCRNYIKTFDGTNKYSPMIGHQLCSGSRPLTRNSTANHMMIEFKRDELKGLNSSFKASFSTHSKECGNGLLTDGEGFLESPGYPLLFPANTYCKWTIIVKEGFVVLLKFEDFNVGQYALDGCQYGIVKLYDGNTTDADKVIGTYCGTKLVPRVNSTTNSLTVVLNAFSAAYTGFRASYHLLQCGSGVNDVCDTKALPGQEIDVQEGFPFGDKARHKIYLGKNGIVSFDYNNSWPVLEPTSLSICVYCALMKTSNVCRTGTSGVYYKIYKGTMPITTGLIKEAGSLLKLKFSPAVLLVFTWKCMEQDFQSYQPNNPGQATFQLILASDWTTSYAFTLYSLTEMNWKYYGPWYPIQIGITQGSLENFQQNVYSKSEYAYHMSAYLGNTGHKGIWVYKVGEIPSSDGHLCDEWYQRNKKLKDVRRKGFAKLPPCPCSKHNIYNGVANQWRYFRNDEDNHLECFILNLATTRRYAPFSKECCYFLGNQTLIQNIPFAGPSLAYTPLLYELRKQYETEDVRAYRTCCFNSTDQRCTIYGDPHIKTLDGREYNYNGIGEINLITIRKPQVNFTLQGRTERTWDDKGVPSNGTVFTALGMEENGVRVFVGIDPSTNTSLIVYANGVDYTLAFRKDFTLDTENFMIRSFNDTCTVLLEEGKERAVTYIFTYFFFRLVSLSGIQGFVTKNDTVMYYEPRMGPSDYSHPEFTPVFLDEAPTTDHSNAVKACGADNKPCIYDFIATGKQDFALETSSLRNQSEVILRQIKNSLPVISSPDKVSVTMNQTAQFTVSARDADNDVVTLHLVEDYNGVLKIDSSTGTVTLSLTTLDIIQISVYAVDSNGGYSPLTFVPLIVCTGCGSHGKCNTAKVRPSSGNFYFQQAVCECQPAWDGEDCQLDKDGCAGNPCHPKQNCSDIPAETQGNNSVGYTCSACPQGFVNDTPASCSDINECADRSLSHCEMLCNNTYGGYLCYCQPGYRLNADGLKCSDINECLDKTDDCQQICNNTDGDYTCSCHEGYIYNPVSNLCEEDQSLKTICQNSGCSQNCRARNDSSTYKSIPECFCNAGFDLDPKDNKTCQDHDECQDHICAQLCSNTMGSFSCSCNNGYMLNDDKRTCSACPYLRYGFECRQMCQCNDREERCDNVKGCVCKAGWTGNINECESTFPCETQHEECKNFAGGFYCTCIKGYMKAGNHCVVRDVCAAFNLTTCERAHGCTLDDNDKPVCICDSGYELSTDHESCQDLDECRQGVVNCSHTCNNKDGGFVCSCPLGMKLDEDYRTCINCTPGTYGEGCAKDCSCGAGSDYCDVKIGCVCKDGWAGHRCDQDIDECTNSSILQQCKSENKQCVNLDGGYKCKCQSGSFEGVNGTCSACPNGTYGENCTQTCHCGQGAERCDNIIGCVCRPGWQGTDCDTDTDECQNQGAVDNCTLTNAICVNSPGTYTCECDVGFFLDQGGICKDIDECLSSPCSQVCINTNGSYTCACNNGFTLNAANGKCEDINECLSSPCSQRCVNTDGSYTCTCYNGFMFDSTTGTCKDVDECLDSPCSQVCINTNGSYICACNNGFKLNPTNRTCEDINECLSSPCSQRCVNTDGGYICSCYNGFMFDNTTRTCDDVDECLDSPCSQVCINTNGSYTCACNNGFTLNTANRTCEDINECLSSPCSQRCVNTDGGYTCTCYNGFMFDSTTGTCLGKTNKQNRNAILTSVSAHLAARDVSTPTAATRVPVTVGLFLTQQAGNAKLSLYFSETLVGFQFLEVTSLRAGSIIADADIFMKSSSEASAKSSLAVALSSLTSSVFCLRQQTATPWLVIGLAAGIPAGLSLLLIAVCPCIARHLRKKKHSKVDEPDSNSPGRQSKSSALKKFGPKHLYKSANRREVRRPLHEGGAHLSLAAYLPQSSVESGNHSRHPGRLGKASKVFIY